MAIPEGYRLLTSADVGKVFGVDLESTVYFDVSLSQSDIYLGTSSISFTNFLNYSYGPYYDSNSDVTLDVVTLYFSSLPSLYVFKFGWNSFGRPDGVWVYESYTFTENTELTSFNTDYDWNNWFYVKETATPKEQFISDMNSLGKSITDKAGASGKKSITELKDLVDNLKTTFTGQEKTVTPSKTSQVITPDSGYDGLSKVTVNVIPSSYIIPSGTLEISENGTKDVTQYASVNVNIQPTYWDGTYEESDE